MKNYAMVVGAIAVLVLISGCIEQKCPDCTCNQTACDCNKTGFKEVTVSGSLVALYPKLMCEQYPTYCNVENVTAWVSQYGIPVKAYDAEWAQEPVYLLYGDTKVAILDSSSRLNFLKGLCDATNASNICTDVNRELEASKAEMKSCVEKAGYSTGMVFFYFSDTCPHCANMKPWVQDLENQSYKFKWLNASNQADMAFAGECLPSLIKLTEGVPQFGCANNSDWQIGEFTDKAAMASFVKKCTGG